ncbi:MAG TPA: iron donor protein CyaY [Spongiibacteraceae bacterium]|nr:iron donor protein CyaY [Spongiibacteraceae bacterium]HUH39064.1 iron donor protein CyaY [Spongiibacteraceae bacterium]
MLSEIEYNALIEAAFTAIEDAVDNADPDLDCEGGIGMLTIDCGAGGQLIFSRQSPTRELWLAARSGGYHFARRDGDWVCSRSARTLRDIFAQVTTEQAGGAIDLVIEA